MSAAELLARARRAGLRLELEPDGAVAFEAETEPSPALLEELRAHRAAIAAELRVEAAFREAAERRRIREAALIRDGDLALLEAERRALGPAEPSSAELLEAERDLERADRALATVEPDPALRAEGVLAPTDPVELADPVEPILALLEAGEPEAAADTLARSAATWLDPTTWRELADLATADPARCRRALEAVLARDPRALDRALDGLEREAAHSRSAPTVPAVTSGHTGHDRARADARLAVPTVPAVPVEPLEAPKIAECEAGMEAAA